MTALFVEIQSEPDHEGIRDPEPNPIGGLLPGKGFRLEQQGGYLDPGGLFFAEDTGEGIHRPARIDDVFEDDDVSVF